MRGVCKGIVLPAAAALFLGGCATAPSISSDRGRIAARIADQAGLVPELITTPFFTLQSFSRIAAPGRPVRFYIEGDGLAWASRSRVSRDPTPVHPVALTLAARDPSENVVYIARPCQYVADKACHHEDWTGARFSEEAVASINAAIDQHEQRARAASVELVGFSGGGAIALLLAQRRDDVTLIVTVAGDLDPAALNRYHRVSPLRGSLDPMKEALKIAGIPQWHFRGSRDTLVPGFVAENFRKASGSPQGMHLESIDGVSHMEGWAARWGVISSSISASRGSWPSPHRSASPRTPSRVQSSP